MHVWVTAALQHVSGWVIMEVTGARDHNSTTSLIIISTAVLGSDWRDQACTVQNMVSAPLMMLLKLFASHFALEQCLGAQVPNFYLPIILFIA